MAIIGPSDPDLADLDTPSACSFCSAPASAFWAGTGGVVFCCVSCATTALAVLAADAVVGCSPPADAARKADRLLDRFRAEFWRAVALAVCRQRRGP